jgi:hypothetical protein
MGNVKLFESKSIRSVWVESEQKWYFSVHDVIEALTDSTDPRQYVKKMRSRDSILAGNWGTICTQVMKSDILLSAGFVIIRSPINHWRSTYESPAGNCRRRKYID